MIKMETLKGIEANGKQNNDQAVIEALADLFKTMGFTSIGEEVRNNRRALDNAKMAIKTYFDRELSDKWNPITDETYSEPPEKVEKLKDFRNALQDICHKYLDNGTPQQREYLKLKQEHDNAVFLYTEKLVKWDELMEKDAPEEEFEVYEKEMSELKRKADQSKNKLDDYAMSFMN